jgi:hypothetical protein
MDLIRFRRILGVVNSELFKRMICELPQVVSNVSEKGLEEGTGIAYHEHYITLPKCSFQRLIAIFSL